MMWNREDEWNQESLEQTLNKANQPHLSPKISAKKLHNFTEVELVSRYVYILTVYVTECDLSGCDMTQMQFVFSV